MGSKRKSRTEITEKDLDLLRPIDLLSLGSDDDPCFGKLHDLAAKECKACGDSEFCSIVKSQGLHKERLNIEGKQRFKDIEEADQELIKRKEKVKKLIEKYQESGLPKLKIIMKVSKEMSLPKDIIKQVYNQI